MLAYDADRRKRVSIIDTCPPIQGCRPSVIRKVTNSCLAYAIAISMFLPFMLFHSTKAAPTIDIAPAATDT